MSSSTSPITEDTSSMDVEGSNKEQDFDSTGTANRLVLPQDGFKWRKYGQKFIKNIGKMRSYFKCQKSNCKAKKKVEWSVSQPADMRIVYEGEHNHLSPLQTSSAATSTSTTAQPNPYDLVTQVFGDNQTISTSSHRKPAND